MSKIIMGIKVENRENIVPNVQELLTEHGCEITTRVGLHVASEDKCSRHGLILLEFIDNADDSAKKLEDELLALGHVEVQKMVF
ncbi:hypothetical protein [Anaeromicropila herbilytica]|uniref:Iron-only hydrogenase system regulator n=1 Tax=Anaeromicropila herbilytica TaxID=2785025 RepID=A0A7R7IDD4_9FIRM|nr:hypothetical protein [Anaeromicropila herbilytica]BCN29903.1 hypothetical protein bsdtb5_11980 [Anaeromicropila herbilytica]